ncbi:MAG: peptidoglycan-binding protein [Aristaeellaceae bacterium]
MKRILMLMLCLMLVHPACAEETDYPLTSEWEPPVITEDCIETEPWLLVLKIAQEEIGYVEGPLNNQSKYGEWFCQRRVAWCAEFLTWCVNEADTRYGTELLRNVYPWYGTSKEGAPWFMARGRFVSDTGIVPGGREKQWMIGADQYMQEHEYIPSPGDYLWIFYYSTKQGPDHVAIVEGVSRDENGELQIHVIEGNNPDRVQRAVYPHNYKLIYGYGTPVRHAYTNISLYDRGDDVQVLEDILVADGIMKPRTQYKDQMDKKLRDALKTYQRKHGLTVTGTWDLETRTYMESLGAEPSAE